MISQSKKANPIKACPERIEFTLSVVEGNGPISSKAKMNANAFSQKDYENETAFRPKKANPIQTQFQTARQPPPLLTCPNHPDQVLAIRLYRGLS
jgi:hypothetical protein